jgi:superfamily II DNA or RNA helicase
MFERFRNRHDDDFRWFGPIGLHEPTLDRFVNNLSAGGWDAKDRFKLRIEGERLAAVSSFKELISLSLVPVEPMQHQMNAAIRVLDQLQGRAFLADEVGLGKTIEAGLIAKELIVRGLARRILVICPASLRDQWADELEQKFNERFTVAESGQDPLADDHLVISLALARMNSDRLTSKPWDLVIVDEVHKFSGASAFSSQRLIRTLSKNARYVLFLTATPVQNQLLELYRLVELLRPGMLGSEREFVRRYLDPEDGRTPRDEIALRRLLADVMVRATRTQAGLDDVERDVRDVPITLSGEEKEIYDSITAMLRNELRGPGDYWRRRVLTQRLTASYRSVLKSLKRMAASHTNPETQQALAGLADLVETLVVEGRTTARERELVELCAEWVADRSKGKVLVFTQDNDTLEDLARLLQLEGLSTCVFHGGLSSSARTQAIRQFKEQAQVMVSTDAGAEGLNLQFANCVINFDLPWNPMRIEQRIGRVHRLTQHRTVYVANLYAANTLDERILTILRSKLRMFELLFGQLTTVLGSLRDTFENLVMEQVIEAASEADQDRRLDKLGEEIGDTRDNTEDELREQGHLNWLSGGSPDSGSAEANELLPEEAGPQGESEQNAEEFVRKYLTLIGCKIVHTDERFVTVSLNTDLAERFDVPELHLAFSPSALNMHPDAEMCVVGSELFDEFMDVIAETGDLLCEVPDGYNELPEVGVVAADTGIQFVDRTVLGPKLGSIEATWRATDDAAIAGDNIITVTLESAEEQQEHTTYRTLEHGESLPASFPTPKKLIGGLQEGSVEQLGAHGHKVQEEADRRSRSDSDHLVDRIRRRLGELFRRRDNLAGRTEQQRAYGDQISNLEAQLEDHQAGAPQVRVKADLLALRLTGSPIIELWETWADASGSFKVTGELNLGTGDRRHYSTDGREISHLTICAARHPIDLARTEMCPCCSERVCEQCADRFKFGDCDLCGVSVCGQCLPESERQQTKSLCEACKSPERCKELDDSYRLGFRIGGSSTLRVGLREAELDANDGSLPLTIVPNEDVDDPLRVQLRTYAITHGLPVSTSAIALPFQTPDLKPGELPEARSITNSESTVGIEEGLPPNLDEAAVAGLTVDDLAEGDVLSEQDSGLKAVLDECRTHNIPQPPTLVVSRVAELRTLTLTVEGLQSATTRIQANAEPELVSEELFGFDAPIDDGKLGLPVASATAGDLTVQVRRVNHSYLLEVSGSPPVFVAGHPDLDSRTELGWADLVGSLGARDARVWSTDRQPPLLDHRLVNPTRPVCTERNTTSCHFLTEGSGDQPAGPPSAYGMGNGNEIESIPTADPHISSVVAQVGGAFTHATEVTVEPAVIIQEQWSDLGETTLSYLVSDHLPLKVPDGHNWVGPEAPLAPVDDGQALTDFEIDWFGQLQPYQEELFDGSALPLELHAQGLKGRLSSKGDIDVVVLAGRIRREIVTLRRSTGEVTKWQTASGRPLPEQRLALAVIEHLGIAAPELEVEVVSTEHRTVDLPSDAFLITQESCYLLSGSVAATDAEPIPVGEEHKSRTPIGDNPLVIARAGQLLGLETQARLDPHEPTSQLAQIFAEISSDASPPPILQLHYAATELGFWINGTGIHSTAAVPGGASADSQPWTLKPMPEWAIGEWRNPPGSVLQAKLDTVSTVLARQGSFFVLATRSTSGPEWFLLSGDPTEDFIKSSIGAELIGEGQVAEVTAITDPGELDRPIVIDGSHPAQDSCEPVAVPPDRLGSAEVSVEFVKDLFDGKYLFPTLTVGEVTVPLWSPRTTGIAAARALVHAATEQLPDTTQRIAIGFEVTDTWQVSDETVPVHYTIRPGQTQGLIECHATGEQLREVTIDRSGHAVGSSEICPYCDTSTCVRCVDPVAPCLVCRSLICGECAPPAGEGGHNRVCEACYPPNLRPVGRFARWQHRQHLIDATAAYSGHDRRHQVLIANFKGIWTVRVNDSEAAPLSAEAKTLLAAYLPEIKAD